MSVLNYSTSVNVIFHHCLIYIMEGWRCRKRGMKSLQSNETTVLQRHLTDESGRQGGNPASCSTCSHTHSRMLSSNFESPPPPTCYFSVRSVALTEEELDPRCSIWWPVPPLEATSGGIGFNLERPLPSCLAAVGTNTSEITALQILLILILLLLLPACLIPQLFLPHLTFYRKLLES